jgi:hypothetical protein
MSWSLVKVWAVEWTIEVGVMVDVGIESSAAHQKCKKQNGEQFSLSGYQDVQWRCS